MNPRQSAHAFLAIIALLLAACDTTDPSVGGEAPPVLPDDLTGRLAYVTSSNALGSSATRIFVIDFDRSYTYLVKDFQDQDVKDLAWSPEGSRITYSARQKNPSGEWRLYSVSEDGLNTTEHFPSESDIDLTHPAWSISGHLAYVQTENEHDAVFVDGEIFVKSGNPLSRPSWSSDESYLIIGTHISPVFDLFRSALDLYSVDGTNPVALIEDTSVNESIDEFSHPVISPFGSSLAFVKTPAETDESQIWTMDINGSNPLTVSNGHSDGYPSWSPDADYVAFHRSISISSSGSELGGIFVVRPDGSDLVQITVDNGMYPAWTR